MFGPTDRVHVGTYFNSWDFGQYAAAMAEGATSPSWLIHDHFSSEPHQPALMYTLYVAMGKLASALGVPSIWVHRTIELIARISLPFALYLFVSVTVRDVGSRRAGFALAFLSGGLTVWLGMTQVLLGHGWSTSGELAAFGAVFAGPHIGLGLAAGLLCLVMFAAACDGSRAGLGWLGVLMLCVGLLYPYMLPVLVVVFLTSLAVESARRHRIDRTTVLACAVAGAAALPFVLYNLAVFGRDPFWSQTYGAQAPVLPPPPWELPTNLGLVAPLAILGLLALVRKSDSPQRLVLLLAAFSLVLMYAPTAYSRRFGFMLHPALAALTAIGWPIVWHWACSVASWVQVNEGGRLEAARRLVVYPFLLVGLSTPLASYAGVVASAATNQPLEVYTLDADTYRTGQWLASSSGPDDVTLGSFWTGNVLGGMVPGRVVVGHETATMRAQEKAALVERFYRDDLSQPEVAALLSDNRVSYVVFGPRERAIGTTEPARLGLEIVMQSGEAAVYRVPRP
jgi:hypothetical protein